MEKIDLALESGKKWNKVGLEGFSKGKGLDGNVDFSLHWITLS